MRKLKILHPRWTARFPELQWHGCTPATEVDLTRIHAAEYVGPILRGQHPNGLGAFDTEWLLWEIGVFVEAARRAVASGQIVCGLAGGFHHAGYASGWGMCTFNGLALGALVMLDADLPRVGIIDIDHHPGDGTQDIIDRLGTGRIEHYSFGMDRPSPAGAERWLAGLGSIIEGMYARGVRAFIYYSGADVHIDDPLGGELTTDQMLRRDRIVFDTCRRLEVPVAWCLAGGYQEPLERTLLLHDNTLIAALGLSFGPEVLPRPEFCVLRSGAPRG